MHLVIAVLAMVLAWSVAAPVSAAARGVKGTQASREFVRSGVAASPSKHIKARVHRSSMAVAPTRGRPPLPVARPAADNGTAARLTSGRAAAPDFDYVHGVFRFASAHTAFAPVIIPLQQFEELIHAARTGR